MGVASNLKYLTLLTLIGVFGLLQIIAFVDFLRSHLSGNQFAVLFKASIVAFFVITLGGLVGLTATGVIAPWTGRFYSLWDTAYAKKHIPIIASVSEHQPTPWSSFFFDLQALVVFFPVGVYLCFKELRDEHVFLIIYSVFGSYFAGVMVRLMLTLTPIVCVTAGIAIATILQTYAKTVAKTKESDVTGKQKKSDGIRAPELKYLVALPIIWLLSVFAWHCTWVTSNAYSSPSIVLSTTGQDGVPVIIDDFREAYYWLRKNTPEDARIMSWWDYGYQLAGMANRTTMVDNNTWNNTHIATVGKAMATSEENAYEVLKKLDVDYVLVIYGGIIGYAGDDINKFLWMIRIAEGVYPNEVSESKFFSSRGEYRVDDEASATLKNSLMYKLSYYRIHELYGGKGYDRVRQSHISTKPIRLSYLEEAYTSDHWIVRIYRVKKPDNLGRNLKDVKDFEDGKVTRRKKRVVQTKL
jgi:dolichyl-diphosphooligosaccharide--protein glycosyltransferase